MKPYEWTLKIKVAPAQVADGLDLSPQSMHAALCRAFPLAPGYAFNVEIIEAPDKDEIAQEQGYECAADRDRAVRGANR